MVKIKNLVCLLAMAYIFNLFNHLFKEERDVEITRHAHNVIGQ
jgi:hypothetical protein